MYHLISAENFGVTLRPVAMEDAEFIHRLRRDSKLCKFIGDVDEQLSIHKLWLKQYFLREGDYYFCIQIASGATVGAIGIYDHQQDSAEWGRWVIQPTAPAAAASAWLIYHIAFDILGLTKVSCRSVLDNKQVVSFHDRCGLERTGIDRRGIVIQGEFRDLVIHTAKRGQWPTIQKKLEAPAKLAQRLMEGMPVQ